MAFAMAVSVLTQLMVAHLLGLIPDANAPKMDARKLQTETLAISGSAIAEADNGRLDRFRDTLENSVERLSLIHI